MAHVPGRGNVPSAAVQGASQAFTAKADHQVPANVDQARNRAQVAASLAGNKPRQQLSTPTESYTGGPRVRQLIQGLQQSHDSDKSQLPNRDRMVVQRVLSRSPSHVAARIASRSSSAGSAPPEDTSSTPPDVPASRPNDVLRKGSSESIRKNRENGPLEQDLVDNAVRRLQRCNPQGTPTASSAQRAANTTEPLGPSSSRGKHRSGPERDADEISAQDSDRGRSLTPHGVVVRPREDSLSPKTTPFANKSSPTLENRHPDNEASGSRDPSEPMPQSKNQSSTLRPQYIDPRSGMTEVSLADAIVASSLASSRARSPTKNGPAPTLSRRSSFSRSLFARARGADSNLSRHGSPQRVMRHTLRDHASEHSEDEDARRKHKPFMKHPNKHREGSRRRWKDKVAERERKRYEGVWAANKGVLVEEPASPKVDTGHKSSDSDLVLDLVVRDIWNRSRLPADTLAEIWDLVDRQGTGTLSRDEFVLGLWLIDQKLKGRKLPIRVSQTLWASVRRGPELKGTHRSR